MLFFVKGRKPENPEKNPWGKVRTKDKLNSHMTSDRNRTWATLAGGECSHHCAIPTTGNAVTDDTYTKGKTRSGIDRTTLAFQDFGKS